MISNRAGAHVTVAIRRREDDRILVLADGTLPMFEDLAAGPWQVVSAIGPSMEGRLGVRVTTLRPAWVSESAVERLYEALWLGGAVPSRSDWVPRADLPERLRGRSDGVARAIASGALAPAAGDRQPWYLPGWLDAMTSWIDDRFAAGGLHRRGPVRQVRSWGRSALLQADTDRGLVWAKQVPMAFAHEVAVTGLLADLDPGLVPPIIAADPAVGRLLLAHVEGPLLSDVTDPLAWTATLARLAETQRVLSVERDRLSVAGVAAAPLATLGAAIPVILADDDLLRVGRPGGVSVDVAAGLRSRADSLAAACDELARNGIPDSLDHGDLSATQVIVGEMGPVIFDWSDASMTHPYLSLAAFLGGPGTDAGPDRADLERAYAAPWSSVVGAAASAEACRLAATVMPLHLARLYRDRVLPGLEQPWEMDQVVPAALVGLAASLRTGAGAS